MRTRVNVFPAMKDGVSRGETNDPDEIQACVGWRGACLIRYPLSQETNPMDPHMFDDAGDALRLFDEAAN